MKASLLLALLLTACATTALDAEVDLAAILDAALPAGTRVIVLAEGLPDAVRRAAAHKTDVIHPDAVPQAPRESLPAGYFVLEKIAIEGDSAEFVGLLGPVPIGAPGERLISCGTRYRIMLVRNASGSWEATRMSLTVC